MSHTISSEYQPSEVTGEHCTHYNENMYMYMYIQGHNIHCTYIHVGLHVATNSSERVCIYVCMSCLGMQLFRALSANVRITCIGVTLRIKILLDTRANLFEHEVSI